MWSSCIIRTLIKPRRIEHLQNQEPFSSDPYFSTFYTLGTQAVAVLCQGHGHETSISNIHYIGSRLVVGIWHTYIDNCSQSLGAQRNSWIFLLSKEYPILKAQCHNLTQWCFRECYGVRRGYFSRLCASLSRLKSYLFSHIY